MKRLLNTIFILFFLISCSPTSYEVWVNKDESGKLITTIDLGEMAGMMTSMFDSMSEEIDSTGGQSNDSMFKDEEAIDSTMILYDAAPDSVLQTLKNPEYLKQITMRMQIDPENEKGIVQFIVNYANEEEFEKIFQTFMEATKESEDPMMAFQDPEESKSLFIRPQVDLKTGIIRVPYTVDANELLEDPEMEGLLPKIDSLQMLPADSEERIFFEMIFGGKVKTTIHAPGKIQFTSDPNAEISGNTVTFYEDILELMKNPKTGNRIIKYNP